MRSAFSGAGHLGANEAVPTIWDPDLNFSKEGINEGCQKVGFEPETTRSISSPTLLPLGYRLQLPNRWEIFGIYALTLLMFSVASPDPNPRGGGQLPSPDPDPNPRGGGQLPNPKSAILR